MGKIAGLLNDVCNERERLGTEPGLRVATLAAGDDWAVEDVVCTYRPSDASFEERHSALSRRAGRRRNVQCRGRAVAELLTPGSLLLGNARDWFECGHEHGTGDRCLAFALLRGAVRAARVRGRRARRAEASRHCAFRRCRACAARCRGIAVWAAAPGDTASGPGKRSESGSPPRLRASPRAPARVPRSPANAERGVARAVRLIERDPAAPLGVKVLANEAGLSPFHFVRAFARVTGLTPHRYLQARAPAAGRRPPRDQRFARHRHRTRERVSRRVELQSRVPRGVRRGAARAAQTAATPPLDGSTRASPSWLCAARRR